MSRQLDRDSDYSDRLLKLIPVEFIGAYVAVSQLVAEEPSLRQPVLISVVVGFTVLIPLYLYKIQRVKRVGQLLATSASFLVWTYSLGDAYQPGPWVNSNLFIPAIGSVVLVLWTSVAPLFFSLAADTEAESL